MAPFYRLMHDIVLYCILFFIIAKQYKNATNSFQRKIWIILAGILFFLCLWSVKIWWVG